MKKYFSLLDPLRLFAAMWVMNYHYMFAQKTDATLHWYRYGNLGVQIFFVISGFVIVQSIRNKSTGEFLYGRFLRLFPLFWILCTATFALTLAFPDHSYTIGFLGYLRSMTMISDLLNGLLGPATLVDSSYWTLALEILFYAQIAFFIYLFGYKNLLYFFSGLLAISIVVFATHHSDSQFATLLLTRHSAYFVFGGTLALLAIEETSGYRKFATLFLLIFSAVYAIFISPHSLPAYQAGNAYDHMIIAGIQALFFLLIIVAVYLSRFVTNTRIIGLLAALGAITYPLYLLHQRIGNIAIDFAIKHSGVRWLSVVVAVQITMLVAAYALSIIDAYFRRMITRRAAQKTAPTEDTLLQIPAYPTVANTVL